MKSNAHKHFFSFLLKCNINLIYFGSQTEFSLRTNLYHISFLGTVKEENLVKIQRV